MGCWGRARRADGGTRGCEDRPGHRGARPQTYPPGHGLTPAAARGSLRGLAGGGGQEAGRSAPPPPPPSAAGAGQRGGSAHGPPGPPRAGVTARGSCRRAEECEGGRGGLARCPLPGPGASRGAG